MGDGGLKREVGGGFVEGIGAFRDFGIARLGIQKPSRVRVGFPGSVSLPNCGSGSAPTGYTTAVASNPPAEPAMASANASSTRCSVVGIARN